MIVDSRSDGVSNKEVAYSITIGKQVWMTENLNMNKFRNSAPIPETKTDEEWEKAEQNEEPTWCYYDNNPKNGRKYGKLCNWQVCNQ